MTVADEKHPSSLSSPGNPVLQPLVISAPFGNYIQPKGATPTLGTFTRQRRPGRLWRTIKTVRYDSKRGGWVNKLGLRNPGIDWLVEQVSRGRIDGRDKLVSIHGFEAEDWKTLLERVARIAPAGVELNMSCPNVGELACPEHLFQWAVAAGVPVVVKLPPVNYEQLVEQALAQGVRAFHCCNTIPVAAGGLSGKPVKPLSLECIAQLRKQEGGDRLTIIGGGGIREPRDIDDYVAAGADHVALGTRLMNPVRLVTHSGIMPLIRRAHERLGGVVSDG